MNNNSEQPVSAVAVEHKSNVLLPSTSVSNVAIVIIVQLSHQNVINIPVISWKQKQQNYLPIRYPSV